MDFNVNLDLSKMLEKIDQSKRLRMLAYTVAIGTTLIIKLDAIIIAVRWW